MYKERKETTHVKVGEEDIHYHIYIYIKDKHNVCKHGHKTDVQEKGSKHSPNKMKHISPLQRHVFLPLTCRILKKKPQFLPLFVMIDKGYKKLECFTREI